MEGPLRRRACCSWHLPQLSNSTKGHFTESQNKACSQCQGENVVRWISLLPAKTMPSKSGSSVPDPVGTENTWSVHSEDHSSTGRKKHLCCRKGEGHRGHIRQSCCIWKRCGIPTYPSIPSLNDWFIVCLLCARCWGNSIEQNDTLSWLSKSLESGILLRN